MQLHPPSSDRSRAHDATMPAAGTALKVGLIAAGHVANSVQLLATSAAQPCAPYCSREAHAQHFTIWAVTQSIQIPQAL